MIAAFAVILSHTPDYHWLLKGADIFSFDWHVYLVYSALVRWPVPVFVMMSGALFLSRDIPIRKIYSKYVFRIFTAFLFWTCIYAAKEFVKTRDAAHAFSLFVHPFNHLWFMPMIAALYMAVPLMKKFTESRSLMKYFLALSLVCAVLVPSLINLVNILPSPYNTFAADALKMIDVPFAGRMTGYFLLGYYLNTTDISAKTERIIYITGITSFVMSIVMTIIESRIEGNPVIVFSPLYILCECATIFIFFKKHFNHENKAVRLLSDYSFGIYLAHYMGLSVAQLCGLNYATFNTVLSVPVTGIAVFALSFIATWILIRILILKKYVV